jgi:hypothetical protein
MDFASLIKLLESIGYHRVNSLYKLAVFKTNFIKDDDIISVHWEMGGHITSIISGGEEFAVEEFVETFSVK